MCVCVCVRVCVYIHMHTWSNSAESSRARPQRPSGVGKRTAPEVVLPKTPELVLLKAACPAFATPCAGFFVSTISSSQEKKIGRQICFWIFFAARNTLCSRISGIKMHQAISSLSHGSGPVPRWSFQHCVLGTHEMATMTYAHTHIYLSICMYIYVHISSFFYYIYIYIFIYIYIYTYVCVCVCIYTHIHM